VRFRARGIFGFGVEFGERTASKLRSPPPPPSFPPHKGEGGADCGFGSFVPLPLVGRDQGWGYWQAQLSPRDRGRGLFDFIRITHPSSPPGLSRWSPAEARWIAGTSPAMTTEDMAAFCIG